MKLLGFEIKEITEESVNTVKTFLEELSCGIEYCRLCPLRELENRRCIVSLTNKNDVDIILHRVFIYQKYISLYKKFIQEEFDV